MTIPRFFSNYRLPSVAHRYLFLSIVPIFIMITIFGFSTLEVPHNTARFTQTAAERPLPIPALAERSMIAHIENNEIGQFKVTLGLVDGMEPIQFTQETLTIDFRDHQQYIEQIDWTYKFIDEHNNNSILEIGELVEIQIPVKDNLKQGLFAGEEFVIDVKPYNSPILTIHKTIPKQLNRLTYLN